MRAQKYLPQLLLNIQPSLELNPTTGAYEQYVTQGEMRSILYRYVDTMGMVYLNMNTKARQPTLRKVCNKYEKLIHKDIHTYTTGRGTQRRYKHNLNQILNYLNHTITPHVFLE